MAAAANYCNCILWGIQFSVQASALCSHHRPNFLTLFSTMFSLIFWHQYHVIWYFLVIFNTKIIKSTKIMIWIYLANNWKKTQKLHLWFFIQVSFNGHRKQNEHLKISDDFIVSKSGPRPLLKVTGIFRWRHSQMRVFHSPPADWVWTLQRYYSLHCSKRTIFGLLYRQC